MTVNEKVNLKLERAYDHAKLYTENREELFEMCKSCECWLGKDHDYEECKNKPCFRFWLAYVYLHWETSWE